MINKDKDFIIIKDYFVTEIKERELIKQKAQ